MVGRIIFAISIYNSFEHIYSLGHYLFIVYENIYGTEIENFLE